jgi:serine/threonine protein kinase/predicted Zn-dependent protease
VNEPTSVQRLTRALDAWLDWKARPEGSVAEFLAANGELRDLLEPLVAGDGAMPADRDGGGGGDGDPGEHGDERVVGDYRLVRELGRGGMGIVHEAVQRTLGRRVALKVLGSPAGASAAAIARFRRESELLAKTSHAHIVPVYDAGLVDGVPFHAMELVDGCTLAAVVKALAATPGARDGTSLARAQRAVLGDAAAGATLPAASHVAACLRVVLPIAKALAAAHEHGIVHRDVKPANILLRRDGTPLLSDFGLARELTDASVTRSGDFAGTPHYVSPEQVAGDVARVDGRTDVFSLAVVAYELLFAARPFDGATTEAVLERVRNGAPPALGARHHGLPADLAAVLDKALQKDPADRYTTMLELTADLEAVLALRPVRARRRRAVTRAWQAIRRQPLRIGLIAVAMVTVPALLGTSFYLWLQQPRIAAATEAERLPQVERLLETMLLHQDFGDDERAREPAEAARALLPNLPEAIAAMAVVEHRDGDRDGLRQSLARLRAVAPDVAEQMQLVDRPGGPDPDSALAWFVRGMLALTRGHGTGDVADYRAAAEAMQRAVLRAPQPRALFHGQYLHALMHLRQHEEIKRLAADTRHLWPDSAFASYWCGFALQEGDPDAARVDLQRAIDLAPDLSPPYVRLAKVLEEADEFDGAYQLYRRAHEMRGDVGPATMGMIRTLRRLDRVDEALVMSTDLVARMPLAWRAHLAHGQVLLQLGRRDDALAALTRAVDFVPRMAFARINRASAFIDVGKPDEALADADVAVANDPANPMAHSARGTALLHLDRAGEAVACFERVVGDLPRDAHAWRSLAMARRRSGEIDKALPAALRATEVAPREAEGWRELGKVRRALADEVAAAGCFERAIELDPREGDARVNLAQLRWKTGRRDEALTLLAAARAAQPQLLPAWDSTFWMLGRLGRARDAIDLRSELCRLRPKDRKVRLELVAAVLAAPATDGHAALLTRVFAELAAIDGASRDDVEELREAAAARLPR